MRKYKYLLFDADNTLFDFDEAEHQAFLMLDSLCPGAFTDSVYSVYHEINKTVWQMLERGEITREVLKKERFRRHLDAVGADYTEELLSQITVAFPQNLAGGTMLISGALEVISELSERYAVYIITNGITNVQSTRLANSPLAPYIGKMYISEALGYDKPDSRYFDAVISDIGCTAEECVVIGDSLTSDIDGALGYGIDCIYYDPRHNGCGGREVLHTVDDLKQLTDLLP